jgi:hypothetical protein
MRCWFFAGSLMFVVLSGSACAADPDAGVAEKDSAFFLSVCKNSVGNLAALERLAAEQSWTSKLGDPEFKPLQIYGNWRVEHGGRIYTITAATASKGATSCFVSLSDPRPRRDDFFAIIAKSLRLLALGDAPGHLRLENYRIENLSPEGSILEIDSMDGLVMDAMIAGPIREPPPPTRPE